MSRYHLPQQKGSSLFVALIMLLVITLLALSGAREVALESRITGNFIEQQKQTNEAEAALREGEYQLTKGTKPLEPTATCATTGPCLLNESPAYTADFSASNKYAEYELVQNSTSLWYGLPTPSGATEAQSENPEYGNMMMGIGTFRYEVNAQAAPTSTDNKVQLRSNVAKVYN